MRKWQPGSGRAKGARLRFRGRAGQDYAAYRKRSDGRVELLQPFELMRVIAASVRTGDEHLPALIEQGISFFDAFAGSKPVVEVKK